MHTARRTTKSWRKVRGCVGGALCHFGVGEVFTGSFDEAMRWCACTVMAAGYCVLVHACCVAFSVYCHTGSAHKCKIRLSCVLNTALDLAAAASCIGWRVGGS